MARKTTALFICVGLTAITLAVFAQVRHFAFTNYDDDVYITENHYVKKGLTYDSVRWAFKTTRSMHWHPVTWLGHMLDIQLFGLAPGAHHAVNLLIHILNVLLLFMLLQALTNAMWPSCLVAALFAIHPLHVETVAWIADRKDLLSTFWGLMAILAYHRFVQKRTCMNYLMLVLAYCLGLMAKPMLISLPLLLLLLDFWPLQRHAKTATGNKAGPLQQARPGSADPVCSWNALIWEKVPLIALALVSAMVTVIIMEWRPGFSMTGLLPSAQQIGNAMVACGLYLGKTLLPHNLAIHYSVITPQPIWLIACVAVLLAGITALVLIRRHKKPFLLFGWLWFLITLIPVLGIIAIGPPRMADRFTYLPLIGVFVMIAWGVPDAIGQWRYGKAVFTLTAGVWLIVLASLAWVQTGYWKDSETLYRHALEVNSANYLVHNNLGNVLALQGRTEQALFHYQRSLIIRPGFDRAHNNMGILLVRQGDFKKGIWHFQKALQLNPVNAKAHNNLGFAFELMGELQQAIEHYHSAMKIDPHYERALENLKAAEAQQRHAQ